MRVENPAGTKNLRRWFKKATGTRGSALQAQVWYASLVEKFPTMKYPLGDRRNKETA